jgi:Na+-translocating ferredoxin:NAD+ oxidoreductase RnfA subunit
LVDFRQRFLFDLKLVHFFLLKEDASFLDIMHFFLVLHFFLEMTNLLCHHFDFFLGLLLPLIDVECHFLFLKALVQLETLMEIFDNSIFFPYLII